MEQQQDGTGQSKRTGELSEVLDARIAGHLDDEHRRFDNHNGRFYCDCGVKIQAGGHQAHRDDFETKLREKAARG
ncbi:hypothetical protein [Arthrobacter sp. HMWF013]|uniref:hypothetical protein n=1 Tax=Arthrobacter sp. HMWF013 TaxID=2056849 RepID=UPI0011B25851|nr:hypothetical protein [Arthrobacter sp. HMWF013]